MEKSIPNLPHLLYTVHTELTPEVNIFHRQDKYTRPPQQHQQHMYPRDVIARRCLRACAKSILIFQKYNFKLNFPGKRRQNFLISACLFQGGRLCGKQFSPRAPSLLIGKNLDWHAAFGGCAPSEK